VFTRQQARRQRGDERIGAQGDKNMLNSIEPAEPDTPMGAIPTAVDGITSH
jgi:hypothetical protein